MAKEEAISNLVYRLKCRRKNRFTFLRITAIKSDTYGGFSFIRACEVKKRDISVPPIEEGRTTEHCEIWNICHLIASICEEHSSEFPIELSLQRYL